MVRRSNWSFKPPGQKPGGGSGDLFVKPETMSDPTLEWLRLHGDHRDYDGSAVMTVDEQERCEADLMTQVRRGVR